MGGKLMRYSDPRPLTAAQQFLLLQKNLLTAGTGQLGSGSFDWRFTASPTPLSRLYNLRLDFAVDQPPKVYVESPDLLLLSGGKKLPHVYEQQPAHLCLYLPRTYEWRPWMRLDQTLVPWASLWLFYFEDWLIDGEWKGGGEHPRSHTAEHRISRSRLQRHRLPVERVD